MIIIRNAEALAGKVRIVFSPFFETCQALAVLERPDPHVSQSDWVQANQGAISGKSLAAFKAVQARLGSLRKLDEVFDLSAETFQPSGYGEELRYFLDRACWAAHFTKLDAGTYARIDTLLLAFWKRAMEPYLAPRQFAIREILRRDSERIREQGEVAYLCSLSPRIRKKGRGATELVIEKKLDLDIDALRLQELRVYASHFSAPFLVVAGNLLARRITFFALCRELERADTPRERTIDGIAALAFALSDSTRLRMLMMAKTPVTQKALGEMVGLAKSTVSRHVSILIESGALERLDQGGGEPRLTVRRERIQRLSADTLALLGLD